MQQPTPDTSQRSASKPAPPPRRFERRDHAADRRHGTAERRLADARRRALVSAWLRSLSRSG